MAHVVCAVDVNAIVKDVQFCRVFCLLCRSVGQNVQGADHRLRRGVKNHGSQILKRAPLRDTGDAPVNTAESDFDLSRQRPYGIQRLHVNRDMFGSLCYI